MSEYMLKRALEVITTLNPNTTNLENAREIAKRALHQHRKEQEEKICPHKFISQYGTPAICLLCGYIPSKEK